MKQKTEEYEYMHTTKKTIINIYASIITPSTQSSYT